MADLTAFDRAVATGREGTPHDVLGRMIVGVNPVTVVREWRGYPASDLARRSGLHRVQLHDIESGKRNGSVATMRRIADALDDLV